MKKLLLRTLVSLSSLTFIAGCAESASKETSYDGKVFDISENGDKSLIVTSVKNGNYYDLVVSGTGNGIDFASKQAVPWNPLTKKIHNVVIEEGVNGLGEYYFFALTIDKYFLPSTVSRIGDNTFNTTATIYSYGSHIDDRANLYYYSAKAPTNKGNYFYMEDGEPKIWKTMLSSASVLFIGNSFTFRQGSEENPSVPKYFKEICDSFGLETKIDFVVRSSYTLAKYADPNDELGSVVESKLVTKKYDYVILQEQSTAPLTKYSTFNAAVKKLKKRIDETQQNCETVLYETWGSPTGIEGTTYATVGGMEAALRSAYETSASENGCSVNYIGKVFTYVYETLKINIYSDDNRHQSELGAFLSAATHARSLFGYDMTTCTQYSGFDQSVCTTLFSAINHEIQFS